MRGHVAPFAAAEPAVMEEAQAEGEAAADSNKDDRHELIVAAANGQAVEVRAFMIRGVLQPTSDKCKRALVVAVGHGHVDCVQVLLAKDVPPGNALHLAAEKGQALVARALLEAKADAAKVDTNGFTPMALALKCKPASLAVAKELLRAGVKLMPDDNAPGLTNIAREVQIEAMRRELRKQANLKVDPKALADVQDKVWKAQREHMRLLAMREEQKAGEAMIERERILRTGQEELRIAEAAAAKLQAELQDLQIHLTHDNSGLVGATKDYDDVYLNFTRAREDNDKVMEELRQRQAEAKLAIQERERSTHGIEQAEKDRDDQLTRCTALEQELRQARKDTEITNSELEAARKELSDWMRDKKLAAEFTAQAHHLLEA